MTIRVVKVPSRGEIAAYDDETGRTARFSPMSPGDRLQDVIGVWPVSEYRWDEPGEFEIEEFENE